MSLVQFESKTENPHFENVYDVSPSEVLKMKDDVKLIDVRQPEEFTGELGHIAGSELLILHSLPQHLGDIPKDQTVVFVCRSGNRSAQATAFALAHGYEHVYNMQGGMLLWNQLQLPIER